jgi:predicted transcriptional regulator
MKPTEEGLPQVEIVNSKNFRCKRFESFVVAIDYPEFKVSNSVDIKNDLVDLVVDFVKDHPKCKQYEIRESLKVSRNALNNACKDAVKDGLIVLKGPRNKPEGYFYVNE